MQVPCPNGDGGVCVLVTNVRGAVLRVAQGVATYIPGHAAPMFLEPSSVRLVDVHELEAVGGPGPGDAAFRVDAMDGQPIMDDYVLICQPCGHNVIGSQP